MTAGGTVEPIDPVRFIGNFSSGKMGLAIAGEFRRYTSRVLLVHAGMKVPVPRGLRALQALTVDDMYKALRTRLRPDSILIMSAAVSDYRVSRVRNRKMKKGHGRVLKLEPTIDILQELSRKKREENIFIGFAAETENTERNARAKLIKKGLDLIVANPVNRKNNPFGSDSTRVYFISRDRTTAFSRISKARIAGELIKAVTDLLQKKACYERS